MVMVPARQTAEFENGCFYLDWFYDYSINYQSVVTSK